METKSVRIRTDVHINFSELCQRLNAKNVSHEINNALKYFEKLNILPSEFNDKHANNILEKLGDIEKKIEKQNGSFITFSDKLINRQFAFLKEHEKQIFKKIASINEEKNSVNNFKILLQNFFYVYELMFEIYQIQLGYYDFGEDKQLKEEDENEQILFLIQRFQNKIQAFVEAFNEILDL